MSPALQNGLNYQTSREVPKQEDELESKCLQFLEPPGSTFTVVALSGFCLHKRPEPGKL